MLIQREAAGDADAIRAVTAAAFGGADRTGQDPPEARLVDDLRASRAWLPELSLVAVMQTGEPIGHVLCPAHTSAWSRRSRSAR